MQACWADQTASDEDSREGVDGVGVRCARRLELRGFVAQQQHCRVERIVGKRIEGRPDGSRAQIPTASDRRGLSRGERGSRDVQRDRLIGWLGYQGTEKKKRAGRSREIE